MTKKHFIAIAKAIKSQRTADLDHLALVRLDALSEDLCDVFKDANANFDRARFLAACGVAL